MERIGQWNVYKIEDVIKMQSKGRKTLTSDGRYGDRTLIATGIIGDDIYDGISTATVNVPNELKPFYCPNCGGNSYKKINGKTVCEYCDTEFVN